MLENEKNPLPPGIYEKITDYLSARFRLGKLSFIEKTSQISVSIFIGLILGFFGLMVIFLLGFGLAEYISFKNGNSYSGFLWVGLGFLLGLSLIFIFKKRLSNSIQNRVIYFLSKILLDDESI
jgi:hypothetical protein